MGNNFTLDTVHNPNAYLDLMFILTSCDKNLYSESDRKCSYYKNCFALDPRRRKKGKRG